MYSNANNRGKLQEGPSRALWGTSFPEDIPEYLRGLRGPITIFRVRVREGIINRVRVLIITINQVPKFKTEADHQFLTGQLSNPDPIGDRIRIKAFNPLNIGEASRVAEHNSESRPEGAIYQLLRDTAGDREQLPPVPEDIGDMISPKDYIRNRLQDLPEISDGSSVPNAPNKGSNVPKTTPEKRSKITAKNHALKTVLDMVKKHGHNAKQTARNKTLISLNFSEDGSANCSPLFLKRFASSGIPSPDISYCPKCKTPMKYRTTCDSPKCTQKYCAEKYGTEKGEIVGDKIGTVERLTVRGASSLFHVFVSPPPDMAPYWVQWGAHLEEMYNITWRLLQGLGASAGSIVAHTHRGRKKDHDLKSARDWLSLKDDPEEISGNGGPFWRVGIHFHAVAMVFQARSFQFLKAMCREIYNLTGWIVHIKPIENTPEKVIKYQLSHAGLFTKVNSKRAMPAIRFYGNFSPVKIRRIDLGVVIEGRICRNDSEPLDVYAKPLTPSTVHRKIWGYLPRIPKGIPDPSGEKLSEILENLRTIPYWDVLGRPITQRLVTPADILKLSQVPDFYLPKRLVPPIMYDRDPYEPDEIAEELPEIMEIEHVSAEDLKKDPEETSSGDPPEISEKPPPTIRKLGHMYDMMELLEYVPDCRFITCNQDIGISSPGPSGARLTGGPAEGRSPEEGGPHAGPRPAETPSLKGVPV